MTRPERPGGGTVAETLILERVRDSRYRPTTARDLVRALRIPREDQAGARKVVRAMLRSGRLVRISGRRIVAGGPDGAVVGLLERRRDGRAVVAPIDGSDPIDIPERLLATAREGDTVAVRTTGTSQRGARSRGAVVEILARERGGQLGIVARSGRTWEVRPLEPDREVLHVAAPLRKKAGVGDVVRYERLPGGERDREAKVLEVLGPLDAPGIDVEVVCRRHALRTEFPATVEREAARLPAAVPADEAARRERFEDPPPVTIDGETARDFDDAIAVERLGKGGWRVYVHIADVAWFVRTGSALDREAVARGTSTYFPDRVVPMLPPRLSDDLCSLRPGEERLVQTAVIDLSADGEVRGHRIADGVIRSRARLTYDQVAAALDGRPGPAGIAKPILAMLREADRVREALEARRAARGSVDFDLPEPQIQVDLEGVMTGVAIRPRNRAHRMIEGLMLLANETVAGRLEDRGLACMYRIHELPDPTKIEVLREFAAKFGVNWDVDPDDVAPGDVQRLLRAVEGRPEYPIVAQVALRSMKQARYAVDNAGHFGLAAPVYAHFTSPIRRYPDLVVHRLARASAGGRRDEPATDPLPEVAAACSTLERNAEAAERELLEWKKIAFMRDRVGEAFDGIVTGIAAFGCFVRLTESLVEGLLRVDRLGSAWFDFDEGRMELRAREGGQAYTLGDRLRVRVDRVDAALRRVELSLEESPPGGERRPARSARGGRGRSGARRGRRPPKR